MSGPKRRVEGAGQGGGGTLFPAEPGNRMGRKPGAPNKTTQILKDAALLAAEDVGFPKIKRDEHGNIIWMREGRVLSRSRPSRAALGSLNRAPGYRLMVRQDGARTPPN